MRFRRRLVLIQVAGVGVVALVVSLSHRQFRHVAVPLMEQGLAAQTRACVQALASVADVGLAADDRALLRAQLRLCQVDEQANPDLAFVAILNARGVPLVQLGTVPRGLRVTSVRGQPVLERSARAYRAHAGVLLEGVPLGSVWAELHTGRVEEAQRRAALLRTAALAFTAASGLAAVLFALHLVKPLRQMIAFVHQVARGNLDAHLAVRASDELAILAVDLNRMTVELARSREQMVQASKMAAVGQLAGGVAHEINNPLAVILGFAQSVCQRLPEDDALSLPLRSIEREAKRCKALVSDLLAFSRKSTGLRQPTQLSALVVTTASLIEHQARLQGVQVRLDCREGLPESLVDANMLQQVLVNLCNNAIDAMPSGGELTLATRQTPAADLEITVRDTGAGIPPEIRSRIFEPFFTTKPVGKGTGLGLALAYEIVQQHGGQLVCESELERGTAMIVTLPALRSPA